MRPISFSPRGAEQIAAQIIPQSTSPPHTALHTPAGMPKRRIIRTTGKALCTLLKNPSAFHKNYI